MKAAFITLSREGCAVYEKLRADFSELDCYAHESVGAYAGARPFQQIRALTEELFSTHEALIYAAPCGVVVRSLASCVRHKLTDPAVVVLDVGARWCVSLLSGHEGGANDLAMRVANVLDAEPVISTTTEAVKDVIVGVGCRRGVACEQIVYAIESTLSQAKVELGRVRMLASADLKRNEPGLLEAAQRLQLPLRFISSKEIQRSERSFAHSEFVQSRVGVPAVAEPAALLAGRRTRLFIPKTKYENVTVALALEDCPWSESAPEGN